MFWTAKNQILVLTHAGGISPPHQEKRQTGASPNCTCASIPFYQLTTDQAIIWPMDEVIILPMDQMIIWQLTWQYFDQWTKSQFYQLISWSLDQWPLVLMELYLRLSYSLIHRLTRMKELNLRQAQLVAAPAPSFGWVGVCRKWHFLVSFFFLSADTSIY